MKVAELRKLPLEKLATLQPNASWSLGTRIGAACLFEAASVKAGNVHPYASFSDMTFEHFCESAELLEAIFDDKEVCSVGQLVLNSVQATRDKVGVNTNLGIILLVSPIALAWRRLEVSVNTSRSIDNLLDCIQAVLLELDAKDCRDVYAAIGIAKAGGLGQVSSMDVQSTPPDDLLEAMRAASGWDSVARMYVTYFAPFCEMQSRLSTLRRQYHGDWLLALQHLQLEWLARYGDTLIARKNLPEIAQQAQQLAHEALIARADRTADSAKAWQRLDDFLRADGHRRNPGTTADLLAAATLFCLLIDHEPI